MPTFLDIGTEHIKQTTMTLLKELSDEERYIRCWPAMTIANYRYGCFITVPDCSDKETQAQLANIPADLQTVLLKAYLDGHQLVRLDADGDTLIDLTVYDWL